MIILIDMDGVIVDFEGKISEIIADKYPEIILEKSRNSWITDFYKEKNNEIFNLIENIRNSRGFIKSLKPIKGSIEALNYLSKNNHEIFICSSPLSKNKYSLSEKFVWIIKNLGEEWKTKLILTKDKTIIKGNILIDDKPFIAGKFKPEWEHVIFDQPYNKNIKDKKRINWFNYREVLGV